MSMENAKEFLKKAISDEALRERLQEKSPEQAAAAAAELGFDLTAEELLAAEAELRSEMAAKPVELSPEDMDRAAGGIWWCSEDAPDGHELGCVITYHGKGWARENKVWCKDNYYCYAHFDECVKIQRAGDECYMGY